MIVLAYGLALYLAVGFLLGAIGLSLTPLHRDEWRRKSSMVRYLVETLLVSMILWLPFTAIYLHAKWLDRKARR